MLNVYTKAISSRYLIQRFCFSLYSARLLFAPPRLKRYLNVSTAEMDQTKLCINIEITSDVACPWCWVGKRNLDTAIDRLKDNFQFCIRWKPFLLNPHVPDEGIPLGDYMRMKFGEEAARRFFAGETPLAQSGKAVGITFTPSRLVVPTKKAHLLLEYADEEGKQHELHEVLFRAYFSDGLNIMSDSVLRDLVKEVGLNEDESLARLQDPQALQRYEQGVQEAHRRGITGVPHFDVSLRDHPSVRQQFSGAQPPDTFVGIFNRLGVLAKV